MPIRIRDIGEVREGHEIRRGAATANGKGEVVLGLGFMLMGENSHEVTSRLRERMAEIQETLPEGVEVTPVYERTELVDQVLETVKENLLEGALLVIAVLFVFLGNLRAGLIVAAAIPLSMLFAAQGMLRFGIAGSLMSLGRHRLRAHRGQLGDHDREQRPPARATRTDGASVLDTVRDAAIEVRKPTMYGELIIAIVFLPVLTLEGIEGKLFRPMALTLLFALAGSLILSLTLMPVLASLVLKGRIKERENWFVRATQAGLRAGCALCHAPPPAGPRREPVLLLIGGAVLGTRIGSEFIPAPVRGRHRHQHRAALRRVPGGVGSLRHADREGHPREVSRTRCGTSGRAPARPRSPPIRWASSSPTSSSPSTPRASGRGPRPRTSWST